VEEDGEQDVDRPGDTLDIPVDRRPEALRVLGRQQVEGDPWVPPVGQP